MRTSIGDNLVGFFYRAVAKPILFHIDPEKVHATTANMAEIVTKPLFLRNFFSFLTKQSYISLQQEIAGIVFHNPIGLSAGYDYEAKFVHLSPILGFGFSSIGTITFPPYGGNTKPRLGRLPLSKSLMVNKGFKNDGAEAIAKKLYQQTFAIPVGISIGPTNDEKATVEESIRDIVRTFGVIKEYNIANSYYELNISCPNLHGKVDFYDTKNLERLLTAVDNVNVEKPIFIKMPISLPDKDILRILTVIARHSMVGVIIGNLQKDKKDKAFVKDEVQKFSVGNFSGKPTWARSNHLIKLAYQKYKKRFIIIGCGGVFSAHDAYTKIRLGASLVQMITGMIYEGPQVISEINRGLDKLLKQDGYNFISEAIGVDSR